MTHLTRRNFVKTGATALVSGMVSAPFLSSGARAAEPITVGGIHDTSGILDILGKPMAQLARFAVHEINQAGGLLGRPLELVEYDPQSNMQLYGQLAQKLALQDRVSVVHGGITSSSREVIRPVLRRFETLYFYNTLYEGGVCDRNQFAIGTMPDQTVANLMRYVMKTHGKRVYVLAADYNFGQISANWVKKYVTENGGEVIETEYFPLDFGNFGPTISKIQASKPDAVISILVGATHLGFYRQWAAAEMLSRIPLASTTFGAGGVDIQQLETRETDGIINAATYVSGIQSKANQDFLTRLNAFYGDDAPFMSELPCTTYEGMMLWAKGVEAAGSLDRMKVIEALESGLSFEGPSGRVSIDPATHHTIRDVHISELSDRKWTVLETTQQVPPTATQEVCDLSADPDANFQHKL